MDNKFPYILDESILDDVEVEEVEDIDSSAEEHVSYDEAAGTEISLNIYGIDLKFSNAKSFSYSVIKKQCIDSVYDAMTGFQRKGYITAYRVQDDRISSASINYNVWFKIDGQIKADAFIIILFTLIRNLSSYLKKIRLEIDGKKYSLQYTICDRYFGHKDIQSNHLLISTFLFFKHILPSYDNDMLAELYVKYAVRFGLITCIDKENGIYVGSVGGQEAAFLNSGKRISDWNNGMSYYYNGYAIVKRKKDNSFNYIGVDGNLISKDWFFDVKPFSDGYAIVYRYEGKKKFANIINADGIVISDEWFSVVHDRDWSEGYFAVRRKNSIDWTFMNSEGKLYTESGFNEICGFCNGYAVVAKDFSNNSVKKYNFIDLDSYDVLSPDMWFSKCGFFNGEYAWVQREDEKCNLIDKNGDFLFEEWLDNIYDLPILKISILIKNGKYQMIGYDGNMIVDDEFAEIKSFYNGGEEHDSENVIVSRLSDKKKNVLNIRTGEYLFEDWFMNVISYHPNCDLYKVLISEYNSTFVDSTGKQVLAKTYKSVRCLKNDLFCVELTNVVKNRRYAFQIVDSEGTPLFDDTYYSSVIEYVFDNGYAVHVVTDMEPVNQKMQVIDWNHKYLLNEWYDDVLPKKHIIIVKKAGFYNVIDRSGKPVYDKWFRFLDKNDNFEEDKPVVVFTDVKITEDVTRQLYNVMNVDGKLLSAVWLYDTPTVCDDGTVYVNSAISCDYSGELITCI